MRRRAQQTASVCVRESLGLHDDCIGVENARQRNKVRHNPPCSVPMTVYIARSFGLPVATSVTYASMGRR